MCRYQAGWLYLWHQHPPSHGYKLAVTYCEHDDTPYGPGLRGCEEIGFLHNHARSIFLILKNPGFLSETFFHNL
jgi:hypothetical protein